MKTKQDKELLDSMSKEPRSWRGVFFYANGRDNRIFVPKRNPSMGWTLNFSNPYAYLVLLAIILIPIIISMLI